MKFEINGREWEIYEASQETIKTIQNKRKASEEENVKSVDLRYYGITYCDHLQIVLDIDLPEHKKRAVLIHELTHCYIDSFVTHIDKQYCEEEVCDIASNSHDIVHKIVEDYFKRGAKNGSKSRSKNR